jgi:hypothetical protein
MRLLTATSERQGERDGDFCHTIEGELVLVGLVCADDQRKPDGDGSCGCGRAFSGMSSMRATTTALVRDLDVSIDDVKLAVEGYYVSTGLGPSDIGGAAFADLVAETLVSMEEAAEGFPVGSVVGRRLDYLTSRSEPSGVMER